MNSLLLLDRDRELTYSSSVEHDWNEVLQRQYQDIWYELEGVKKALHNEMGLLNSLFAVPR